MKPIYVLCLVVLVTTTVQAQAPETNAPAAPATVVSQEPPLVRVTLTPRSRVFPGSEAVEAMFWRAMGMLRCAYYVTMVCHVLLTLWVIADIRKRRNGQWLWVLLTLLGGFIATAVYALVRMGDKPA